ncbi:MAG: adenylate/guanylate cyclase domain-containing protein [Leptospiraceae bacterium]|nr:adenylate/guanylate cyclase domain-containing protein [Leptospiraceae bacterium]
MNPNPENREKSWTIRRKLASLMLVTIFLALTGMILTATYFFRKDVETRIKENAIQVAIAIGSKIRSDFTLIIEKINLLLSLTNDSNFQNLDPDSFEKIFFKNDKYFIMIGIFSQEGSSLVENKILFNKNSMLEFNITEDTLLKSVISNSNFQKTFQGNVILENTSQEIGVTTLGLSFPFRDRKDKCIVAILHTKKILESFEKKSGIIESQLVNSNGDVIAHFDDKMILTRKNIFDNPVVKNMLTSKFNNGQIRYENELGEFMLGSFRKIGLSDSAIISTVPEDKALEEVFNIRRRNIYILIITLCVAFLIVYNFSVTLTKPIVNLLHATREVQKGNYDIKIEPKYNDEVGQLTESFVEMSIGLKEREKAREALKRFVNEEIAEMALKGELKLGGEKKECVIFFSDIRNFTSLTEGMEPEDVLEFLNEYFTHMVNCVNLTDGKIDKFIGDAIMATWGIPISSEIDFENAVNGALLMRFTLRDFNVRRKLKNKIPIFIGCGINSGPVIVGQIGSYEKLQYTVIGDTVNLSSRLESLNKEFGTDIIISSNLYEKVKDKFKFVKLEKVKVKGISLSQVAYAVLGEIDDPNCPKDLEELRKVIGFSWSKKDKSFKPIS